MPTSPATLQDEAGRLLEYKTDLGNSKIFVSKTYF